MSNFMPDDESEQIIDKIPEENYDDIFFEDYDDIFFEDLNNFFYDIPNDINKLQSIPEFKMENLLFNLPDKIIYATTDQKSIVKKIIINYQKEVEKVIETLTNEIINYDYLKIALKRMERRLMVNKLELLEILDALVFIQPRI